MLRTATMHRSPVQGRLVHGLRRGLPLPGTAPPGHLTLAMALLALLAAATLAPAAPALAYERRLNCGEVDGVPYVDSHGNAFEDEQSYTAQNGAGYVGGWTLPDSTWKPVGGTPDPALYKRARFDWTAYRFDVPNGDYLVRLHFADTLSDGPGFRSFDITVEDSLVAGDLDVAAAAGDPHYALVAACGVTVADGQLDLIGTGVLGVVYLSAIEVVSWPHDATPPAVPTGLTVWSSYNRISLDWDDNLEADVAGYVVERGETPGGPYSPLPATPVFNSRHHDDTAAAGPVYFYRVSAIDVWGNAGAPTAEGAAVARDPSDSGLPMYEIEMDPADYHTLLGDPASNVYLPATFRYGSQTWLDVGVRFRGRISRELPKKSWKVKFNAFVPGQRFLADQQELNLNAHHGERTLLREALAFHVERQAGVPASQARHVGLMLNGESMGVFTESEQVDKRWLDLRGFNTSGNLYKSESGDLYPEADSLAYTVAYSKKTNASTGYDDLIALIELIAATPGAEIYHTLAPIFDIEEFINYYATQLALRNDSFVSHNFYLYHDLIHDRWHYLPWDLDSTWGHQGTYDEGVDYDASLYFGLGSNGLITKLWGEPHFRRRYLERTLEITDEVMPAVLMDAVIDSAHALMIDDARIDWHKWGWEDPQWVNQGNETVKSFIPLRATYVQSTAPGLLPSQTLFINEINTDNDSGLQDEAGDFDDWFELVNLGPDTLDLAGTFITDDITLPAQWAVPDTTLAPGAFMIFWADNEPLEGPTHTSFRLDYGGEFLGVFGPLAAGNDPLDTKSWGPQYRDVSFGRFPDGGYNWTLMPLPTPGAANTDQGNLPPLVGDTQRDPLVVGLNVPVTISTRAVDDDGIAMVNLYYEAGGGWQTVPMADDGLSGDGAAGDDVWGGQIPGVATPDTVRYYVTASDALAASSSDPRDAPATTFLYAVGFVPPDLYLNELMALNTSTVADEWGEFDDWVEIYNGGAEPLALGGLRLSDNLANPDKYVFADTTLQQGQHLLVWCDNDPLQGSWHAGFRLSASGEELGLFGDDVSGFAIIDTLTFGVQLADTSLGRSPDGGPVWVLFSPATPGGPNIPIGVGGAAPAAPRAVTLGPLSPNPFNRRAAGAMHIAFALPDRRRVTLLAYDVNGRAVARLVDRVLDPGHHLLSWGGRGQQANRLASGVYFLRLEAGAAVRTAKITILR